MKRFVLLAVLAAFGLSMLGLADDADARRFGGGSSFGKQRMSSPAPARSMSQKQAAPAQAGQRGSARTGMMGMLGGLAMGGLLGALFFGGAFEGINFLDIAMIGGVLALLFFFLRRRSAAASAQPAYAGGQPSSSSHDDAQDFATDDDESQDESLREPAGTVLRPNINADTFLPAAKEIYVRMQKAWDSADSEDIRKFCTPEIAERIASDMKPGTENRTEVTTLNAEIADGWIESDLEWVAVNFTAMLREQTLDGSGATVEDQSAEVNETWIFQHDPNSDNPIWYVAGIQQSN
ncbi:MAG: TIM44-like domain-containing protein [Mariprofundus sp.]